MDSTRLPELVDTLMTSAHSTRSGRAAQTLYGSSAHHLRQTVIAMTANTSLAEHDSPGEATLQVLRGHVVLTTAEGPDSASDTWEGVDGDLVVVPASRHGLLAQQDSAILLTVSTR